MQIDPFEINKEKPICLGTGLVALDIVMNNNKSPKLWAGGSCGNVLTILSYLGWKSYPIARLAKKGATKEVLEDFQKWDVKTDFISKTNAGSTPIIVEKIYINKKGDPHHRFEWICPNCGAWLPRYKPVLRKDIQNINALLPENAQAFYFDRISPSCLDLLKNYNGKALIVFEPQSVKDEKLFLDALEYVDVLKYSHTKAKPIQKITNKHFKKLEVETLGHFGLRFRFSARGKKFEDWTKIAPFPVEQLVDSAGSGDWVSAGMIHLLGQTKKLNYKISNEEIIQALQFGQALASVNCQYEGARGLMYSISKSKLKLTVQKMLQGTFGLMDSLEEEHKNIVRTIKRLCPSCN